MNTKYSSIVPLLGAMLAILFFLYWINRIAVNLAFSEVFGALFVGLKILFFVGLGLGVLYVIVHVRNHARLIKPTKHGPVQAVQQHGGEWLQLASPAQQQLDPMQQLQMLKSVMQLQSQMAQLARRSVVESQDEQKQIAAPQEGIPAIVRYADIEDEIPPDMSLLGIHPSNGDLELTSWEKLKALWLVGSSSTGKSNTIYGKALEARNIGAKIAVVDQHAAKSDSLARKLESLKDAFARPIAVSDEQVLATLAWFKAEFERRVSGAPCSQKIVLICDEMNRMVRNEALIKPLQEIVAICGEESRGFGMYGWFLSQKCAGLKWLRDSAITVIAHRLTRFEEALLACNDDRQAAKKLLTFKVGRSYIYGVDFDAPIELQQPLYETSDVVEADTCPSTGHLPHSFQSTEQRETEVLPEVNGEAAGRSNAENSGVTDLSTIKTLREIGKRLRAGEDKSKIVKSFGLPYGRATQEMSAVVDMVAEQVEREG